MNIRLTRLNGKELNVHADHLAAHLPSEADNNKTGSTVILSTGLTYEVTESSRSIRGYVKKAYEPQQDTAVAE